MTELGQSRRIEDSQRSFLATPRRDLLVVLHGARVAGQGDREVIVVRRREATVVTLVVAALIADDDTNHRISTWKAQE